MADSDPFGGEEDPVLDISPLIDVAFLLLIYFLVTTTLQKSEADLSLVLPGVEKSDSKEVKIDQMLVAINAEGLILVNEEVSDSDPNDRDLPNLTERLWFRRLRRLPGRMRSCNASPK